MRGTSHLRTAAGFLLTVLLCLLVVTSFAAASFVVAPFTAAQDKPDKPERRAISVSVMDKEGNFVEGLTAENFEVKIGRKQVRVDSARVDVRPRRIAIVLDISGSMEEQKLIGTAELVAFNAVTSLTPNHHVSFYTISTSPEKIVTLTNNRKEAVSALKSFVQGKKKKDKKLRRTALWDTLYLAATDFPQKAFGDVIYLITDGGDSASKIKKKKVEEELLRRGIRVFSVCLDDPYFTRGGTEAPSRVCRRVAEVSGGWAVALSSRSRGGGLNWVRKSEKEKMNFVKLLRGLYWPLIVTYRVVIELPETVKERQKLKVKVVDENGKKKKKLKLSYPRYLFPLEEPPEEKQ